ncbi:hypothetical protein CAUPRSCDRAFT_12635 [Caulochytrium protostelioides]|uniref:Uncharacterized protein n=1 Tax=Caulochytrium protostelioides TaxID=1555241 RepID=A0A4P9WTW3_9FUNG|nr:hypothetical protein CAUPRSCDRAFT_12635 [Caulochytrium protostelioides]
MGRQVRAAQGRMQRFAGLSEFGFLGAPVLLVRLVHVAESVRGLRHVAQNAHQLRDDPRLQRHREGVVLLAELARRLGQRIGEHTQTAGRAAAPKSVFAVRHALGNRPKPAARRLGLARGLLRGGHRVHLRDQSPQEAAPPDRAGGEHGQRVFGVGRYAGRRCDRRDGGHAARHRHRDRRLVREDRCHVRQPAVPPVGTDGGVHDRDHPRTRGADHRPSGRVALDRHKTGIGGGRRGAGGGGGGGRALRRRGAAGRR